MIHQHAPNYNCTANTALDNLIAQTGSQISGTKNVRTLDKVVAYSFSVATMPYTGAMAHLSTTGNMRDVVSAAKAILAGISDPSAKIEIGANACDSIILGKHQATSNLKEAEIVDGNFDSSGFYVDVRTSPELNS